MYVKKYKLRYPILKKHDAKFSLKPQQQLVYNESFFYFCREIIRENLLIVLEKGNTDLAQILKSNKILPEEEMRQYWRQMISAVNIIHQSGIVHADLKPANFLLVDDMLKLIDFGIANGIQVAIFFCLNM